jgi:hypothetical protein
VSTMRESGLEGFPAAQWFGLLAPARTPEGVIGKLNAVINARLRAANMLGIDACSLRRLRSHYSRHMYARPVQSFDQRRQLPRREPHHPVHDRRPFERTLSPL